MKDKVISILSNHDALRAHERAEFVEYLTSVFTTVEKAPAQIADLTARLEKLEKK